MLRLLTDLFDSLTPGRTASEDASRGHTLELATAVLMIEVIRADGTISAEEQDLVMQALGRQFSLSPQEQADLFALAHEKSEQSHDLYSFTARLNQSLDEGERVRVFEMLWTAAYADGRADAHEAHLLRRIGDLLHLRHADAIGAKLRAEEKASRQKKA